MGLTIFEETFGTERVRFGKVSKREATVEHLAAITNAVQKVVDTFRDPNTGQRFIVSLSPNTEAYTSPDTKRIVVSYQPIFDKGLRVSTVCTVMTGLVLHEIGHTLYTFPNSAEFAKAFGIPGKYIGSYYDPADPHRKAWDQLAYTVLNIGDDARLEARMVENLPVAKSVFPTMLHWVAITAGMVGEAFKWRGKAMSMADRVNFAGRSVRYPWTAKWSSDANTRAERAWWVNWGADYIALDDHDAAGMVALTKVALDRLRNPADLGYEKEPPPPVGPKGQTPGPGGSKPGTEDEDDDEADDDEQDDDPQPGEGKGNGPADDFDREDEDEDSDEDEDDEDADDDESDEDDDDFEDGDGDDEGNPGGDDDEDSDDADDDEQDDEGNPGGSSDDDEDADDDEQDDEGGSKTDAPTTDNPDGDDDSEDGEPDGPGKDGAQKQDTKDEKGDFKQDFDAHDLKGNVDAINHPTDWNTQNGGTLVQKLLDSEQMTERVSTGKWGTAKVETQSMAQFVEQNTRRWR